jgi:hypothetical protein
MDDTTGAPAWKDGEQDSVLVMGDMYGLDLRKTPAPITPTQAIKEAMRKGVDTSVISIYSHRPRTGLKLARDTNLLNRARAGFGVNLEQ